MKKIEKILQPLKPPSGSDSLEYSITMSLSRKFSDLNLGTVDDQNEAQMSKNEYHKKENKSKRIREKTTKKIL